MKEWIPKLTDLNLQAVYDIALDLLDEIQLIEEGNPVSIPIYKQVIRFEALCPASSVGMVDRYCEIRWRAIQLLEKHKIVSAVKTSPGSHRWESRIRMLVNHTELQDVIKKFRNEYDKRFEDAESKNSLSSFVTNDPLELLRLILQRFHSIAVQLRNRYSNRPTLDIADEYDVQDLLHSILMLHFDDIRPEEWTPSYAGKSARVDFLLKQEKIVIEVKKTRKGLGTKEVGDELIIDSKRYQSHPDCKTLVCFIYDPENRISNPIGLIDDINQNDEFYVETIISPKIY